MDDGTAEVLDPLKRSGQVGNGEVGQRSSVAGTRSTLVHSQAKVGAARFPALPGLTGPWGELGAEDAAPKPPGTLRVVGRELDQGS